MKKAERAKLKILVCDPIGTAGLSILGASKRFLVVDGTERSPTDLKKAIRNVQGVIVRSSTKLTSELIREARVLRIIGRAGVGWDNIDIEAASKRGVLVVNTPGGNTISAAEHTVSLMLSLSRNVVPACNSMRDGKWERKKFIGVELFEKTLGLVGLGRIGTEVAKRVQGFGMQVIAHDPYLRAEQASRIGVVLTDLDDLFRRSDFISLHVPLTPETENVINQKSIQKMKPGVRIVNCARGGLMDEKAVLAALNSGKIAGMALDVYDHEPPGKTALVEHPKVLVTPHLGASTEEAQVKVAVDIARTMVDFFSTGMIRNAVNMPSIDAEVFKEVEPYISLAEKIGLMHAQLIRGSVLQVSVRYDGAVAQYPMTPITVAVLKGLLTPILAENINYVNATVLAKERGIKFMESKSSEPSTFANLIHVTVKTEKETRVIGGTLYTRNDARIVLMDKLRVELDAKGYVLCISNKDVPGMVGQIGTFLGRNKINIADMTVGRDRPGGRARTLISIDNPVSDTLLKKIKGVKNILDARLIKL